MGMAASQARLLTLTARIHDIEYQAQTIENAKIQLSTQEDQAYSDYCDALDATTLTLTYFSGADTKTVAATFNNLCSVNRLDSANGSSYALRDKYGRLIVSQDVYDAYQKYKYKGNTGDSGDVGFDSGYMFSMYVMCGLDESNDDPSSTIRNAIIQAYNNYDGSKKDDIDTLYKKLCDYTKESDVDIWDENEVAEEDKSAYEEILKSFETLVFQYCSEAIYNTIKGNDGEDSGDDFNKDEYSYYVSIFNQIDACGGQCISIDDSEFTGAFGGNVANDSDWLQAMVEAGKITINTVTTDSKTGEVTLNGTSPSSDSSISYTATTTIDKTALTKAEAEYEQTLRQIDKKDKQYDLSLSKLESERSALTTEYDSVKKVIDDNVQRTFGIFS